MLEDTVYTRPYYARVTDVDMRATTAMMSMYKAGPDGKALQWEVKLDRELFLFLSTQP